MIDNGVIRSATNADSQQVSQLIFAIWNNEYGFNLSQENYPDLTEIEQHYRNKKGQFFVFLVNNEIIGTIAYNTFDKKNFVLKRMFVRKDFRGKGIAQNLLDKIFEIQRVGGDFYLSTKADLAIAAKRFYLRNGFEIIEKSDLPKGFPFFNEDDLFMKKSLQIKVENSK